MGTCNGTSSYLKAVGVMIMTGVCFHIVIHSSMPRKSDDQNLKSDLEELFWNIHMVPLLKKRALRC